MENSKNNKKTSLSIVNDTNTAPDFVPVKNNNIVPYGSKKSGKKNGDYPDLLIGLYQNSSLHSSIINGKSLQIKANSFMLADSDNNIPYTEDDGLNEFFTDINSDESINDLLPKNILDHQIFGGFANIISFNRDFTKITRVQHVAFDKLRSEDYNDYGKVDTWYYSNNWFSQKAKKRPFKVFKNLKDFEEIKEQYDKAINTGDTDMLNSLNDYYTVIFYHNNYTPGRDFYPLPTYVAAIESIDASQQVDTYFNNIMKKGFSADGMLILKGNIEDNTFDEEAERIKNQFTGAQNSGELMITRTRDDDSMPEYVSFAAKGTDGRVDMLIDETTNRILSTHGVTSPLLVGIKTEGQLGGATELATANDLFYTNTVQPNQIIISDYYNKILTYNELPLVKLTQLEVVQTTEENTEENNDNQEG